VVNGCDPRTVHRCLHGALPHTDDTDNGNGSQIFITGSPESENVYAKEFMAATGHPSQRLHFVDPEKGRVTASYLIWLD